MLVRLADKNGKETQPFWIYISISWKTLEAHFISWTANNIHIHIMWVLWVHAKASQCPFIWLFVVFLQGVMAENHMLKISKLNIFEMQETDCSTFYSCHTREMLSYSIVWSLAGLSVRLMPTHIKEFELTFLTYFGAELRSPDRVSYCNSSSKLSCLHFCMWQLSRSVGIQFMDDYCKACQFWHSTPANIVTFFFVKITNSKKLWPSFINSLWYNLAYFSNHSMSESCIALWVTRLLVEKILFLSSVMDSSPVRH